MFPLCSQLDCDELFRIVVEASGLLNPFSEEEGLNRLAATSRSALAFPRERG
jgi:hypothetical protein